MFSRVSSSAQNTIKNTINSEAKAKATVTVLHSFYSLLTAASVATLRHMTEDDAQNIVEDSVTGAVLFSRGIHRGNASPCASSQQSTDSPKKHANIRNNRK